MWCVYIENNYKPVEGLCGGFDSMDEKAFDTLRNGLEDSYWYGDDDEKVFNDLVRKAEVFDEIKSIHLNMFGDTVRPITMEEAENFGMSVMRVLKIGEDE